MKSYKFYVMIALLLSVCMITISACGKEIVIETVEENIEETEKETVEESVLETVEESEKAQEKHKITIADSKENSFLIKDFPKSGMAGEEVSIQLYIVTDVIPHIYVNGEESGTFTDEYTYAFIMPDEDVLIESKFVSAWESGPNDDDYLVYDMGGLGSFEYPASCDVKKENMSFLIKKDEDTGLENDAPYMRIDFIVFEEGETVDEYYGLLFDNVLEYYADRTDLEVNEYEYPVDGRNCPGFEYGFNSKDGKRSYKGVYVLDQFSDVLVIYEDLYLVSSEYEEDEVDLVTESDFEHLLATVKFNY